MIAPALFLAATAPALPDTGASVLRVLGALLLVLALFFAGIWFFKNSGRLLGKPPRPGKLQLLEVKPLGNRQALHVIGYGPKRLLIAVAPTGVSLVSPLPDADPTEPATPATPSFGEALQQVLNRKP